MNKNTWKTILIIFIIMIVCLAANTAIALSFQGASGKTRPDENIQAILENDPRLDLKTLADCGNYKIAYNKGTNIMYVVSPDGHYTRLDNADGTPMLWIDRGIN